MPNLNRPKGFEVFGSLKQTAKMQSGAACFPGDLVALNSAGQVAPVAAGAKILGLCLSYASASGQDVLVSVDPTQLYVVKASATEVDVQSDIGNCADIVATAGNTTYKTSRQTLDSSTLATGTAQLLLVSIEAGANNAFGANVNCVVKINESQLADSFAGI